MDYWNSKITQHALKVSRVCRMLNLDTTHKTKKIPHACALTDGNVTVGKCCHWTADTNDEETAALVAYNTHYPVRARMKEQKLLNHHARDNYTDDAKNECAIFLCVWIKSWFIRSNTLCTGISFGWPRMPINCIICDFHWQSTAPVKFKSDENRASLKPTLHDQMQTPSTGLWHPSFNHCCI